MVKNLKTALRDHGWTALEGASVHILIAICAVYRQEIGIVAWKIFYLSLRCEEIWKFPFVFAVLKKKISNLKFILVKFINIYAFPVTSTLKLFHFKIIKPWLEFKFCWASCCWINVGTSLVEGVLDRSLRA